MVSRRLALLPALVGLALSTESCSAQIPTSMGAFVRTLPPATRRWLFVQLWLSVPLRSCAVH